MYNHVSLSCSGVRESEEKIRNGKDVVPDLLTQGVRRFGDQDEAMMTGTITPSGMLSFSPCFIFLSYITF